MPHLIFALVSLVLLLLTVRVNRIVQLSISGMIGVVLAVIVDTINISHGLYKYERMLITIDGYIPIFHYLYIYATTILYLNWLPNYWKIRIIYTVLISTSFLIVESIMNQLGAIVYLKWQLWYSYILILLGLSVVSTVTNKLKLKINN